MFCFALLCSDVACFAGVILFFLASVMACSGRWLRCLRLRSHEQEITEPGCAALVSSTCAGRECSTGYAALPAPYLCDQVEECVHATESFSSCASLNNRSLSQAVQHWFGALQHWFAALTASLLHQLRLLLHTSAREATRPRLRVCRGASYFRVSRRRL